MSLKLLLTILGGSSGDFPGFFPYFSLVYADYIVLMQVSLSKALKLMSFPSVFTQLKSYECPYMYYCSINPVYLS